MKIEIWSDYVCPFCYIGKKQLEQAIQDTGFAGQVELVYKSYQLDPTTPVDENVSTFESLAKKYGMSLEKAKEMTQGVAARAKEVGLDYNFDKLMEENTLKAHRLVKWAEQQGDVTALVEALLHNYFIEAKRIGQDNVLIDIAEQVGLNREEVAKVLSGDDFKTEVETDIQEGLQLGVRGVPFFVLNRKYGISGAQPQEVFEETLRKVAEEEGLQPGLKMAGSGDSGVCTDDSCKF
ncbi:DsbA family oxidoreductase [Lysinibacillus agricola]|uniref:DsbA family oxidoreductase n=1 Tax=Lysinibacillus agricola TaxID=2590012 RepID=A0ABX7AQQ9_9BACI|nr:MULTISPECIES: DsbA family oxidoreductase [Lysinibacillus]KOS63313.1 disulfide bond formation protein DsbA [Lysinibacillus sp. FJAT-14222]QQP12119.1 DsbA family oxidoreductase [Lysinibacillus agricola]